jgi:uncharacterized membrane protein YraQ (UPF0718 family)
VREEASEEIKLMAARRAGQRARTARWDLDVAVFLFAVLIIVIILLFQDFGIEVVAPVAIFGLVMVWLVGWRRGRQLYQSFYDEEMARLTRELVEGEKKVEEAIEETIEEKVQKALRERWQ